MDIILLKKAIGIFAAIVILIKGYLYWRTSRSIKKIPDKSTEELKSIIAEKGNITLYGTAITELKNRRKL